MSLQAMTNQEANVLEMLRTNIPKDYTHTERWHNKEVKVKDLLTLCKLRPNNFHAKEVLKHNEHEAPESTLLVPEELLQAIEEDKRTYIHREIDHARREFVYTMRIIELLPEVAASPPETVSTGMPNQNPSTPVEE